MTDKSTIQFKNPFIDKMLEQQMIDSILPPALRAEAMRKRFSSVSIQEIGEDIIAGYWHSLLHEVMMNTLQEKDWIYFSYETIHNLPAVLTALYQFQKKNGYSDDRNADVVAKTIGAVMYGLAMNEHGCDLIVERGKRPPLWGDALSISVRKDKKTDFLKPALQTLKSSPFVMDGGCYFEMTPIIDAYKETTGVNLADYRIGSIMIH